MIENSAGQLGGEVKEMATVKERDLRGLKLVNLPGNQIAAGVVLHEHLKIP